jgi:signal transduction histidine kinase
LYFEITDTGIGIPEDKLATVLIAFLKARSK